MSNENLKIIHFIKNGVGLIFSDNKNKHKDLHCILDDNGAEEDDLNTRNIFKMRKNMYDDYRNNDHEKLDHEDDIINSEYYTLINGLKNI